MSLFNERLKELKDRSGLPQFRIAEELGITPQAFSTYINGREPNYDTLIKIANYFDVTLDYLLGIDNFKNNKEYVEFNEKIIELKEFLSKTDNADDLVKSIIGIIVASDYLDVDLIKHYFFISLILHKVSSSAALYANNIEKNNNDDYVYDGFLRMIKRISICKNIIELNTEIYLTSTMNAAADAALDYFTDDSKGIKKIQNMIDTFDTIINVNKWDEKQDSLMKQLKDSDIDVI